MNLNFVLIIFTIFNNNNYYYDIIHADTNRQIRNGGCGDSESWLNGNFLQSDDPKPKLQYIIEIRKRMHKHKIRFK